MNLSTMSPRTALRLAIRLALLAGAVAALYFFGKVLVVLLCALVALVLVGAMTGGRKPRAPARAAGPDPQAELTRRGGAFPTGLSQLSRPPGIDL